MWSWRHVSTSGPGSRLALGTERGLILPLGNECGASRKGVAGWKPGWAWHVPFLRAELGTDSSSLTRISLCSLASWHYEGQAPSALIPTKCTHRNAHVSHCFSYWYLFFFLLDVICPELQLVCWCDWEQGGCSFILCLLSSHVIRTLVCIFTFWKISSK